MSITDFSEFFQLIITPQSGVGDPGICNYWQNWVWSCGFFSLNFVPAEGLFLCIHKAWSFHVGQLGFSNNLSRNSEINSGFPNSDTYRGELLYLTDTQERNLNCSYLVVESIKEFVVLEPQPMAVGLHVDVLEYLGFQCAPQDTQCGWGIGLP